MEKLTPEDLDLLKEIKKFTIGDTLNRVKIGKAERLGISLDGMLALNKLIYISIFLLGCSSKEGKYTLTLA